MASVLVAAPGGARLNIALAAAPSLTAEPSTVNI
jgi:hypothetical protein